MFTKLPVPEVATGVLEVEPLEELFLFVLRMFLTAANPVAAAKETPIILPAKVGYFKAAVIPV